MNFDFWFLILLIANRHIFLHYIHKWIIEKGTEFFLFPFHVHFLNLACEIMFSDFVAAEFWVSSLKKFLPCPFFDYFLPIKEISSIEIRKNNFLLWKFPWYYWILYSQLHREWNPQGGGGCIDDPCHQQFFMCLKPDRLCSRTLQTCERHH